MSIVDKSKPDVLRVTEYVLEKGKRKEQFSVCEAAKTSELNGIDEYRISEILRDICLQPNGPNSLDLHTTIDTTNMHNLPAHWQLNSNSYFNYLSYLALLRTEEGTALANESLKQSRKSNYISSVALVIAVLAFVADTIKEFFK